MSRKGTLIKALFLLLVFSLNTVVGFVCSLGGFFHTFHHANAATVTEHHGHQPQKEQHRHDHHNTTHQHNNPPSEKEDNDCCSKNLVAVEKMEKAVSRTIQAPSTIFLTSFLASYSSLFCLLPAEENITYPSAVRWRLPFTIQDLRIVIQSFQI